MCDLKPKFFNSLNLCHVLPWASGTFSKSFKFLNTSPIMLQSFQFSSVNARVDPPPPHRGKHSMQDGFWLQFVAAEVRAPVFRGDQCAQFPLPRRLLSRRRKQIRILKEINREQDIHADKSARDHLPVSRERRTSVILLLLRQTRSFTSISQKFIQTPLPQHVFLFPLKMRAS